MNILAGGGKTMLSLLRALRDAQDPAARVLIVRLSYPLLKAIGGIIEESHKIYPQFGAEWRVQPLEWHFPNGAMIKFVAMPSDRTEVQGWQLTSCIVDEGAEFQLEDILALRARLRGADYKGKMSMTITCNPSRHSWLYEPWVDWCLDPETGVPKEGTEDIIKWYVILSGKIRFGDSPEELYEKYGAGYEWGKTFIPLSFRFIPMDIYSNPVLLKNNPTYLADLLSQSRVNQLRFLHGSWTAVSEGSSYVNRENIKLVDRMPDNWTSIVRSWDVASTKPSEVNPNPDYTASVLLCRDEMGHYTICHAKRFREEVDVVLKEIVETGHSDGVAEVPVTIPRDAGSGGKAANMFFTRHLAEHGLNVSSIVISGHAGKVKRFLPMASLIANGHVSMVRDTPDDRWNDDLLTQLETFNGDRGRKDDWVDALADAGTTLMRQVTLPSFSIPTLEMQSPVPTIGN